MKKIIIPAVYLFLFFTGKAQQYICYIDYDYSTIKYNSAVKRARYVLHPCFVREGTTWRGYQSSDYQSLAYQKKYRIYYSGRYLHALYASYRYDITGLNVLDIRQDKIPLVAKEGYGFHNFEKMKSMPPLLASNMRIPPQPRKVRPQKTEPFVSPWIESFLEEKAGELKLGRLPYYPPIDTIKNCWQVNDSVYIVQADLNLQIYCILDTIPFSRVDAHEWDSIEKLSIGDVREQLDISGKEKQEQPIYADANGTFHKKWKSKNCFFIRVGDTVRFIGHSLHFIDQIDLDGDGSDELIFRKQGSSYISYMLITDKFQVQLERRVIQ